MADNKRWFKVWTTLLADPDCEDLHNREMGVWVRLGALIAAYGIDGSITLTKQQFIRRTHLYTADENTLNEIKNNLQKINVQIDDDCNGNIIVTFKKWKHYQVNTDSYERVKIWRKKHSVTKACNVTKEKEKDKEKDKEETKKRTESSISDFIETLKSNPAYKGIDIEKELGKMDAWLATPKGRGRKKTHAFVVNWLNKIDTVIPQKKKPWED